MGMNRKKAKRGQLQIAETLIAVSLMLVLALLLINAANQMTQTISDTASLNRIASDIITTADENGLLRPVIYLYNDPDNTVEFETHLTLLEEYIATVIPPNTGYTLLAHKIINATVESNYFVILGSVANIAALIEGGDSAISQVHLGSFTSSEYGQFYDQFLVQLYLWEKI